MNVAKRFIFIAMVLATLSLAVIFATGCFFGCSDDLPPSEGTYVTVTFKTNSQTGQRLEALEVDSGSTIEQPTLEIEKIGSGNSITYMYVSGWYTDANFNTKWDFSTPVTQSMILYAKWDVMEHSVVTVYYGDLYPMEFYVLAEQTLSENEVVERFWNELGVEDPGFVSFICYTDSTLQNRFNFNDVITEDIELYGKLVANAVTGYRWYGSLETVVEGDPIDYTTIGVIINTDTEEYTYAYSSNNALWELDIPNNITEVGKHRIIYRFASILEYTAFVTIEPLVAERLIVKPDREDPEYFYKTTPDISNWDIRVKFSNDTYETVDPKDITISMPTLVTGGYHDITLTYAAYNLTAVITVDFHTLYSDSDCFEFDIIGGQAILSGVTDKGKTEEELIVPPEYNGYLVKQVKESAFANCQNVKFIYLPNAVTYIGKAAFQNCYSLKSIGITNNGNLNLDEIKDDTFNGCVNLTSVAFWEHIKVVGARAFMNCTSWSNSVNNLTDIGESAFRNCDSLRSVDFSNFNAVGKFAFASINNGKFSVVLPDKSSVNTLITADTFSYNMYNNLGQIVSTDKTTIASIDLYATSADENLINLLSGYPTLNTWTIRGNVRDNFLNGNEYIKQIAFSGVESIGAGAFEDCVNLVSVDFTAELNLLEIKGYAFSGCSSLEKWGDNNTVVSETIGEYAFFECAFDMLSLINFKSIGEFAFADNDNLKSVTMTADGTVGGNEYIGKSLFANCINLETVKGTAAVISEEMFANCAKLQTVDLETVRTIEGNAFYSTTLSTFAIGKDVKEIAASAFANTRITELTIEKGNDSFVVDAEILYDTNYTILYKVFGDSSISIIEIKDTVTTIATRAFENIDGKITLLLVSYVPPEFQENWNIKGMASVICNPYNLSGYEAALNGSADCSAINGESYCCIVFDPSLGDKYIKSYVYFNGDTINSDVKPTDEDYYYTSSDESILLTFPYKIKSNMYFSVNSKGWAIEYDLQADAIFQTEPPRYIRVGESGVKLVNPTTDNGKFLYWQLSDGTPVTELNYADFNGTIYLKAIWEWSSYYVFFELNGGYGFTEALFVEYGMPYGELPTVSRTGYTFVGWYYNDEKVTSNTIMKVGGDHTLTAKWSANSYIVFFDYGEGIGTTSSKYCTFDEVYGELPVAEKTGYSYGWYYGDKLITADTPMTFVANHTLTAKYTLNSYRVTINESNVNIVITRNDNGLEVNNGDYVPYGTSITINCYANSGYENATCDYMGQTIKMPAYNLTINGRASQIPSSCLIKGTLIYLSDGSSIEIEKLKMGDIILAFDHMTGKYVTSEVIYTYMANTLTPVISLKFSNGTKLEIVNSHGLFDLTLNKYVLINIDSIANYIGHEFVYTVINGDKTEYVSVKLTSFDIEYKCVERYDIVTKNYLNHIANGLLACSDTLVPVSNIFEFDNLSWNEEKMNEDIETYGTFKYDEFADYVTLEVFENFRGAYFKIAIGKGLMTMDDIFALIEDLEEVWLN